MKLRIYNVLFFTLLTAVAGSACAQLPEDVRDTFERLVDDLDTELSAKFKKAIERGTSTVEFTPAQFRRFRDDPNNPFDGLDGVDARDGMGNIALKFELPSIRNRSVSSLERQSPRQLRQLQSVVGSAAGSTVAVFEGQRQLALGIVVAADGLVMTKASEVDTASDLICQLPDGQRVSARVVRADPRNDVAMLAVDTHKTGPLLPVSWSDDQPRLGTFVAIPDINGKAISMGSYSSNVRSTLIGEQAFLGVQPRTTPEGVKVFEIQPGSASYDAGLRDGDIVLSLAGVPIHEVSDLVNLIRSKKPGDRIEIDYRRNGADRKATAELSGRQISGERAARFKMMSRLGAIPSRRADGFPMIFQHDAPLFPEQCGGPIVDLDGNVIGMNIARNGRASTYAIPSSHLKTVIDDLTRESIAQRVGE